METEDLIEKLRYYLELDGPTSKTEAMDILCDALLYSDYITDNTYGCILQEVKNALDYYERNTRVEIESVTHTCNQEYLIWT